ncbi:hypothetical protein [Flavobacterium sp.]|uniref:hypothetical protein n=1 Tax=Flavobacterium sp. TaxID=239 RepID=UPI0028BE0D6F|nr:hypothetical protein [Flavobacterium sp.]
MKILTHILLLFAVTNCFAQSKTVSLQLIAAQEVIADSYVGTDSFDNYYTIQNQVFKKKNKTAEFQYKNIALGKIESTDLQNPLQIVLFYKQMNAVVLLDNQLNETIKINFSETNPELFPTQVRLASQNRLWLYDQNSQKLGLYDFVKNHFQPITANIELPIVQSQSNYNYFYWTNNQLQLFASNIYGKINLLGNLPEFDQFELLSSTEILLKKDNILSIYNCETKTSQIIPTEEKSIKSFYYRDQILSIFTNEQIRTYKIILP